MGRLEGRAALITGAARGIGLAIAAAFVAEGACVALADPDAAARRRPRERSEACR
jgi:D-sorbitol dehydrogenase (acceptor)